MTPTRGREMRQVHDLKILPIYFEAVDEGRKTFEVRKNDRNFQNADEVILREWHSEHGYSGRELKFIIGYVLPLDRFYGPQNDYVVFSLLPSQS